MNDMSANQYAENKRRGDGQRGHDEFREYPKMLTKGLDHVVVDDVDAEIAANGDGWYAVEAAANPLKDEVASLRAQLAAAQGVEFKRGPGRPPRTTEV